MYKIYIVEPGETIETIARNLNVTEDLLKQINGFDGNTSLQVGDQIIVPKINTNNKSYIVKKGDNPYAIAQKYNISVNELLTYNGLDKDDYIYPNQILLIPSSNKKYYITKNGDTIKELTKNINLPLNDIVDLNETIYLIPNQMIYYN